MWARMPAPAGGAPAASAGAASATRRSSVARSVLGCRLPLPLKVTGGELRRARRGVLVLRILHHVPGRFLDSVALRPSSRVRGRQNAGYRQDQKLPHGQLLCFVAQRVLHAWSGNAARVTTVPGPTNAKQGRRAAMPSFMTTNGAESIASANLRTGKIQVRFIP